MRSSPVRLVLFDDHPIILDGLRLLLDNATDFEIQAEVTTWDNLMSVLTHTSDLLILDLNIRGVNIVDRISTLQKHYPRLLILVFSSYNLPSLTTKAIAAGVQGYLLKDTTQSELLEALYIICNGGIFIGKNVYQSGKVTIQVSNTEKKMSDDFEKKSLLTDREKDILRLITSGLESQEIADLLHISLHTVQSHRKNILHKLELHTAADLVRFALKNGFSEPY